MSVIDLLDRVLDKGIVIDSSLRVSVAGIDLVTVEARFVVASISTYLTYASGISELPPRSRAVASERRRVPPLDQQLRRIREQLERGDYDSDLRRRAEDQLVTP